MGENNAENDLLAYEENQKDLPRHKVRPETAATRVRLDGLVVLNRGQANVTFQVTASLVAQKVQGFRVSLYS